MVGDAHPTNICVYLCPSAVKKSTFLNHGITSIYTTCCVGFRYLNPTYEK